MEEEKIKNTAPGSYFYKIAAAECVLAVIIIAAALTLKFFFPESYAAARQWYKENAAVDTDPGELIKRAKYETADI